MSNFMKVYPYYYTATELGSWRVWTRGPMPGDILEPRRLQALATGRSWITFKGIGFHALTIGEPAEGPSRFARWDLVNGWTRTIEEVYINTGVRVNLPKGPGYKPQGIITDELDDALEAPEPEKEQLSVWEAHKSFF